MNDYEKLIATLKKEYESSKSVADPDWNQIATWTSYVPKEIKKVWKEIPDETKFLLYFMGLHAYRQGH